MPPGKAARLMKAAPALPAPFPEYKAVWFYCPGWIPYSNLSFSHRRSRIFSVIARETLSRIRNRKWGVLYLLKYSMYSISFFNLNSFPSTINSNKTFLMKIPDHLPLKDTTIQITSLTKYFPFIAVFIPLIGLTYSIFYYSRFGINITEYITFSELFILELENVILVAICLFFLNFILINDFTKLTIKGFRKATGLLVLAVIANFILFKYYDQLKHLININKDAMQLLFFYGYLFYGLLYLTYYSQEKKPAYKKLIAPYIAGLILFAALMVGWSRGESLIKTPQFPKRKGVLELNNTTRISFGTDTILLGQNTSYLFFYVKKDHSTFIISKGNMLMIKFNRWKTSLDHHCEL